MRAHRVATGRLELQLVESGPQDGIPVVLIHGNLSTGRFFEHLFEDAPERYRLLAPDMRGFGDTEHWPGRRARDARDPQRPLPQVLQLGRDRRPRAQAAGPLDARCAGHRHRRRSPWEVGTLGRLGVLPGWPGADAFPPQPMVTQIRQVLERYAAAGGRVESEWFERSGHFPPIDARERWSERFFGFLASVE